MNKLCICVLFIIIVNDGICRHFLPQKSYRFRRDHQQHTVSSEANKNATNEHEQIQSNTVIKDDENTKDGINATTQNNMHEKEVIDKNPIETNCFNDSCSQVDQIEGSLGKNESACSKLKSSGTHEEKNASVHSENNLYRNIKPIGFKNRSQRAYPINKTTTANTLLPEKNILQSSVLNLTQFPLENDAVQESDVNVEIENVFDNIVSNIKDTNKKAIKEIKNFTNFTDTVVTDIKKTVDSEGNKVFDKKIGKRSNDEHEENVLPNFNINNLLETFINTNKSEIKSIHVVVLMHLPEHTFLTNEENHSPVTDKENHQIGENEKQPILKSTEKRKRSDFIKVTDAKDVDNTVLKEYFTSKINEMTSTSTDKIELHEIYTETNKKPLALPAHDHIFIGSPFKILKELIREQNFKVKRDATEEDEDELEAETDKIDDNKISTRSSSTNDKETNIQSNDKESTLSQSSSTNSERIESESKSTSSLPESTNEKRNTSENEVKQKSYFLIVTLPTVICLGILMFVLCFLMRENGWCCKLFKDVEDQS